MGGLEENGKKLVFFSFEVLVVRYEVKRELLQAGYQKGKKCGANNNSENLIEDASENNH